MNTPSANVREQVENFFAANSNNGIAAVIGLTQRGPLNKTDIVVRSWPQFQLYFGNEIVDSEFPTLCRRALERGAALRVASVKNQSDVNNASTTTATLSTAVPIQLYTLSAALTSGKTISFTPYTATGYAIAQAFAGSAADTLNILASKIKAAYPTLVKDVVIVSTTVLQIIPMDGVSTSEWAVSCTGASAPTVTGTTVVLGKDSAGTTLFTIAPKYVGDYSKMVVEILPASNGNANNFDVAIYMSDVASYKEVYKNIRVTPTTVPNSNYLLALTEGSLFAKVTYTDQSAATGIPRPVNGKFYFTGGSVGNALTDADRIGVVGIKTGIYAFNGINDFSDISFLTETGTSAAQALETYAKNRGDICALFHLANSTILDSNLVAERQALGLSSSHSVIFAGGLAIVDALKPNVNPVPEREISELGDVLGASCKSAQTDGAWKSPSNTTRGYIDNALRVVNNQWMDSAQLLANNQINFVTSQDGKKYLWHSFTAQTEENALSFWNVRRMVNELKKTLKPMLKKYIEEPNDIATWYLLYLEVKPTLEERVSKRAIFNYSWNGDQFATSLSNLTVNNETAVRQGKYKVILRVKEIVSMQEIDVVITLDKSGVSFEDTIANTNN